MLYLRKCLYGYRSNNEKVLQWLRGMGYLHTKGTTLYWYAHLNRTPYTHARDKNFVNQSDLPITGKTHAGNTIHYIWLYKHNKITEYSIIGVSTTSGSCCRSATSITAGGFPSSYSWLYMETNSARPISRKDGAVIFSKDGWHDISNQTMLWQMEQHVKKVNRHN